MHRHVPSYGGHAQQMNDVAVTREDEGQSVVVPCTTDTKER
jgi:hypothetical protein